MADHHDSSSKPARPAPPPFVGPARGSALPPRTRADRPTLPPFSPPFVKRPSPTVPVQRAASTPAAPVKAQSQTSAPAWLDSSPNDTSVTVPQPQPTVEWIDPDHPVAAAPAQPPTGIEWLDSPPAGPAATSKPAGDDTDDVFGWDPAEERAGAFGAPSSGDTLEALKELEPWAIPGSAPGSTSDDVAAAIERIAARIRSGDLHVPGAPPGTSDEALLAAVLAALLQRARA
jgi:hypothetical protein